MTVRNGHTVTYEYIDCVSRNTGRNVRLAKVQNAEFLWPTSAGERPTDTEIYIRKEGFLRQLEEQQSSPYRYIYVLYLRHKYPDSWEDVIAPLFVIDADAQDWHSATLAV